MSRGSRSWRTRAACADSCADEWFPDPHARVNPQLLRVCAGCPVWRDCLLFTLAHPDIFHGVWAGLTAGEIAVLRQRLLSGELGAEVIETARQITQNRGQIPVYARGMPDPLPGTTQLRRQRRHVLARLRAVELLERDEHHRRVA